MIMVEAPHPTVSFILGPNSVLRHPSLCFRKLCYGNRVLSVEGSFSGQHRLTIRFVLWCVKGLDVFQTYCAT